MENVQTQTLYYKTKDGEWVAIPYSVINIYDAYVQYCTEHNLNAVDRRTYYQTLGNLAQYVTELQRLTGSLTNLEELTNSLQNGVLPVTLGGTGNAFESEALFIEHLSKQLKFDKCFTTVTNHDTVIKNLSNTKLNNSDIQAGVTSPDKDTEGLYYFQYEA